MGKIRNPKRFSDYFGVAAKTLKQRGVFNPILNADTRLFIDPLLLSTSKHPEMRDAHSTWSEHFGKIIRLLAVAKDADDPPWRRASELLTFREFKGTCLGYGSGTIDGSGIGPKLRGRILKTAHRIVELGITDPELFALLPLLEEKVGPDRISDMTTRIIRHHLASFTKRAIEGLNVPTRAFKIDGEKIFLPVNPFVKDRGYEMPITLVPSDVLRSLPMVADWSDVADASSKNQELRRRVNSQIAKIWQQQSSKAKQERKKYALTNSENFEAFLKCTKTVSKEPYDMDADPDGRVNWLELGRKIAEDSPLPLTVTQKTIAELLIVVGRIIERFEYLIEHQGKWKLLYDQATLQPLHEHVAQQIFFVVADSYCEANNIGVHPETDQGGGPVDFAFSSGYSARVAVEMKLSTNKKLVRGYTTQLEAYKKGERTDHGHYVILDVGKGATQIAKVQRLETAARNDKQRNSEVTVIDARRKNSASKL